MGNIEDMEMTGLAWNALKDRHSAMKEKNPGFTLIACLMLMNKVCVKAANERGDNVVQLPKIEVEYDGGVYDYTAGPIRSARLKQMKKRKAMKGEDPVVLALKCETGLTLSKNQSSTAKRGRDTDEFQARRAEISRDAQSKWLDAGNKQTYNGSKGGTGSHDHGDLSKETINCPLVEEIQKRFAPEGSSAEVTLDGHVQGFGHFLEVINERGELPTSIKDLYEVAGKQNEQRIDQLVHLMGRTLEPNSQDATFDLEGMVKKLSATDGVTEVGMCVGSLGTAAKPRPMLDERGCSRRADGRRATLDEKQLERVANVLAKQKTLLHHAGKEKIFLRAVCEDYDLPMPDIIDVFSCICLGVGRNAGGGRRAGFKGQDAVVFGMESLAYIFKLGRHSHVGVQDACKQHVAWRPILIALRMHYYGA